MIRKFINWYNKEASIRKKIIISFLLLVCIPIIVLGYYSYDKSKKNLEEQTISTMENNINRLVFDIGATLDRENTYVKYLAYNLKFRSVLENNKNNNIEIAKVLNEYVEPIFWYFIASDTNIKEISVYTPSVSDSIGSFLKPDTLSKDEEWYKYHDENFDTLWTFEDDKLFATRSILDVSTSTKSIGVLKMELFLSSVLEIASNINYLDNGIIITDENNQLIYKKDTRNTTINELILEKALSGEELTNENKNEFILRSENIENCGWKIYYYINKENIISKINFIIISTLLVSGICLILVVILISILSKVLSSRILVLRDYAQIVAEGNLDNPISSEYTDEIGIVTNSFGNMTRDLNNRINEVYKMEIEKKASELKALQAMINPHFLYNSLSSIKWKAIKSGNEEISEITGLLAKFYRTNLNNGKQVTTVANELENIKAYIEIEKLTHDNLFEAEYKIDEGVLQYIMLNFILQPIVENAIKHGVRYIEGSESKGLIIIEFIDKNEHLIFNVYNNGPTINLEDFEKTLKNKETGYGIYSVQQKIDLYYGEGCGLSASVTSNGYTCFTVKISKEIKNNI